VSSPAVRVAGLEKRFGAVAALRGVDLTVETGSIHVVLGPNGAGKTTLLRVLAGLAHPTKGEVTLCLGDREARAPRNSRDAIGYVGHASLLYPELSARENLVFTGRLHHLDDPASRADLLLEEAGLGEVADRRAGTFSRGMVQRLAIARARVQDPALVLLDEPFTGLDRRASDRLAERLAALRAEGRTLVLITHDLRQASALADRCHILIRGQVAALVEADELAAPALEARYLAALDGDSSPRPAP
jgi:heme ABC exporter ATP-binding subunit CcmA